MKIEFQPWTQVQAQEIVYELALSGKGKKKDLYLPIDAYTADDDMNFI